MSILFLSQLLPYPPDAGPKVRSYFILRYLAQKHAVTLLTFTRPDDKPEAISHLEEFCQAVHTVPMVRSRARDVKSLSTSLVTGQSFIINRDFVPGMALTIDRLLETNEYDIVHADQLWMAQYALRARDISPGAGLVLDEHNACFQIFQRLAQGEKNPFKRLILEREWRALKRYEGQACAQFDHVVTVTQEDRACLEGLVNGRGQQKTKFFTIPICVDPQGVKPVAPVPGSQDVLHLGTMFWLPNVEGVMWFANEVWSKIIAQIPDATFTIVGKKPPTAIEKLKNLKINIQVTGYVPDPSPYLEQAGVFIVPLLSGSGMRVKILDAWRWGLPIVSTQVGAEGINYRDGENILIADTPDEFANAVVNILTNQELAESLRENGRRWVEQHYDWQIIYKTWDTVYKDLDTNLEINH
ncbi:glycosyltransferase family 4 protein [Chloroflexota bacterium]